MPGARSDYQGFTRDASGRITPTSWRLTVKRATIPLPDLRGRSVLDVGCHSGFWSLLAADLGASRVVGLDPNPVALPTTGHPAVTFRQVRLGAAWPEVGRFDVVLLLSVYHHIYQATGGDHRPIWTWLARHVAADGVLLAEVATSAADHTVRDLVDRAYHGAYTWPTIAAEAAHAFTVERIGPSRHEPHRDVCRLTPRPRPLRRLRARVRGGAGLASRLMQHGGHARLDRLDALLGWRPVPGTLNLTCPGMAWDADYYRAELPALVDRRQGPAGGWRPRWCRFYPLTVDGHPGVAMRFEQEYHPTTFVEVLAPIRLRDVLPVDEEVTVAV